MEVEFELLMVLGTSVLFTIAHIISENYKPRMLFGLFSAVCWVALAIGFIGATPTFLGFTFLFMGIFLLLVLSTVWDTLEMLQQKKNPNWWKE